MKVKKQKEKPEKAKKSKKIADTLSPKNQFIVKKEKPVTPDLSETAGASTSKVIAPNGPVDLFRAKEKKKKHDLCTIKKPAKKNKTKIDKKKSDKIIEIIHDATLNASAIVSTVNKKSGGVKKERIVQQSDKTSGGKMKKRVASNDEDREVGSLLRIKPVKKKQKIVKSSLDDSNHILRIKPGKRKDSESTIKKLSTVVMKKGPKYGFDDLFPCDMVVTAVEDYDDDEDEEPIENFNDFIDYAETSMDRYYKKVKISSPVNLFIARSLEETIVEEHRAPIIETIEEKPQQQSNGYPETNGDIIVPEITDEIIEENAPVKKQQCEKPSGQLTTHKTENGYVIFLETKSTLYLYGLLEIHVGFGTIEVLGKNLTTNDPTAKIYSPRGSAFLSIINRTNEHTVKTEPLRLKLMEFGMDGAEALKIIGKVPKTTAVFFCKTLEDKSIDFIQENIPQTLLPLEECKFKFYDFHGDTMFLKVSTDWENLLQHIVGSKKVMLCGGKGVGKSTLLRYLVNRLLDTYEAVNVIDLDPGQAEFTVAGCVSHIIVKQPLLGPNYTHLMKPESCIFVPNIDTSADFDTYLLCIKELMKITVLHPNVPTLINHMGFTRGIGINLVSSAICDVKPNIVVQIQSNKATLNFEQDLTVRNVKSHTVLLSPEDSQPEVSFYLLKIKSCSAIGNMWALEPRQMREMSILSYFSTMLPDGCNYLTQSGVKIYKTNLSGVNLMFNGKKCDPKAVDANIVALCTLQGWQNDKPFYNCHGWGIVRGVSIALDYLVLLTPLSEPEMDSIDHLVLGSVNLPPSIYMRNHCLVTGLVPYVYQGDMSNFAQTPKRSFVPKVD